MTGKVLAEKIVTARLAMALGDWEVAKPMLVEIFTQPLDVKNDALRIISEQERV